MKARFEQVSTPADASWRFFHRQLEALPFEWHFHPQYELTLTLNSAGKRYVGDHIGAYAPGDLALIGPNLPHSWQSLDRPDPAQPHTAFVLWFSQDWADRLMAGFPEYRALGGMLGEASRGLTFDAAAGEVLTPVFESLVGAGPRQRLRQLLALFEALLDRPRSTLASASFDAAHLSLDSQHRLNQVLNLVHEQFDRPLTVEQVAMAMHMSVSTFNRFFRRHMNQSFHQYLLQVRLGHACSELIGSERPVAWIADRCGFRNLANFNRLFRKYKGRTPTELRAGFGPQGG